MKPEFEQKLCSTYPKIFKNRNSSYTASCMAFGIECGDGWFHLLETLCVALDNTYTTSVKLPTGDVVDLAAPHAVADQVKEKFGTLRFYFHLEYDEITNKLFEQYPECESLLKWSRDYQSFFDGIVHYAEALSSRTCEITGLPGVIHTTGGIRGGWYKILNEEFAKTDPACIDRNYLPLTKTD